MSDNKKLEEFHNHNNTKWNKQGYCKECSKGARKGYLERNREKDRRASLKARLKKSYNLSLEDYELMMVEQENKCYICKNEESVGRKYKGKQMLSVDHCHKTGKVRKLLCQMCNRVLGLVKEDKQALENMIQYLKEHIN